MKLSRVMSSYSLLVTIDLTGCAKTGAFCASDKLQQQIVANQGENRQQSDYSVFPKLSAANPIEPYKNQKRGLAKTSQVLASPLYIVI